jgi:hypothetical protein
MREVFMQISTWLMIILPLLATVFFIHHLLKTSPYLWTKAPLSNLRYHWYVAILGIKNLLRFRSVVWHFDTCDYSPMLRMIQVATREMADATCTVKRTTDWQKRHRELIAVSELCRRLIADEYFENAGYSNGDEWKRFSRKKKQRIAKHAEYMNRQDAHYLGKMFKNVCRWWF